MEQQNLYYVDFAEFDEVTDIPAGNKIVHEWRGAMILLDNMCKGSNVTPYALHLVAENKSHFYSDDEQQELAHRGDNSYRGTIDNKTKAQIVEVYNAFRRKNKTDDLIVRYSNGIISIPSFSVETIAV